MGKPVLALHSMADVAATLGKSVRWLQQHLKTHPCGRRAGKTRLFTDADLATLVNTLPKDIGSPCPSSSSRQKKDGRKFIAFEGRTEASISTELQKLLPKPKQQPGSRSGRSRSTVVSFPNGLG